MSDNITLQREELQRLCDELFIARNRRSELQEQLAATTEVLMHFYERVTLSDQERAVLNGHGEGCVGCKVASILRRVVEDAA